MEPHPVQQKGGIKFPSGLLYVRMRIVGWQFWRLTSCLEVSCQSTPPPRKDHTLALLHWAALPVRQQKQRKLNKVRQAMTGRATLLFDDAIATPSRNADFPNRPLPTVLAWLHGLAISTPLLVLLSIDVDVAFRYGNLTACATPNYPCRNYPLTLSLLPTLSKVVVVDNFLPQSAACLQQILYRRGSLLLKKHLTPACPFCF